MSDQPKQHPPAPPAQSPEGGGYVPLPPDPKGDAEAVAMLMGMTAATSKDLAENVIGEASSLTKQTFDAHSALKRHMTEAGQIPPAGVAPQAAVQPVQPPQPVHPAPQQYQQAAQVYQQPPPPSQMDDGLIIRKLLAIEDKLDSLLALDEKIVKQLSRKSAKQLTIRFNDSEDKKSD